MTRSKPAPHGDGSSPQARVAHFLATPGVLDGSVPTLHATHASLVFVGRSRVLKIKRAVHLPFLDYSSLEKRRAACLAEVAVNHEAAPEIYLGVVPITERDDGSLAIGGPGTAIEWAVEMRAFEQSDLLASRADANDLAPALLRATADVVLAMHARAAPKHGTDPVAKMRAIIDEIATALRQSAADTLYDHIAEFERSAAARLAAADDVLRRRAAAGFVRRCHGDLHLANIVVWNGRPTPFDAIEFSEEIATVDTLYDLAFLLMDLDHRGNRAAANLVLNRYLLRGGVREDVEGLRALPLFLGLRAGIRAMVATERGATLDEGTPAARIAAGDAQSYLGHAVRYLTPPPPCLVAVGGFSGTGKSTLAATLAPGLSPAPGALHLRSDVERKTMLGVDETERLDAASYTADMSERVYARLYDRAAAALAAGHSVVVDAVFQKPAERARIGEIAASHGAAFQGLWLEADAAILRRRVAERVGDASDATGDVVDMQIARGIGTLGWTRIDAGGGAERTHGAALAALAATVASAEAAARG
jgi:aminoglycoside phosphotransferase family enzyme/predicted kinase